MDHLFLEGDAAKSVWAFLQNIFGVDVQGISLGDNNPFNPIVVEEGEILGNQNTQDEEIVHEEDPVTESGRELDSLRQNKPILIKSNSANQLADLVGKDHMDHEPLMRSNSMSDIPAHCKESRLDYLREEFHHFHLIAKHLQRTKEETLKRLQLMESRQSQERNYQEDIQNYLEKESQLRDISQVPETQLEKTQEKQSGEVSQKKKKGVQVGKKPITRAAKKHTSPKKQ